MIHGVSSDLPSFKSLSFREGLNIVVAEKTLDATDSQTRNGAGKTSLIELIHFLAGSGASRNSIFRSSAISNSNFSMVVDLDGRPVTVTRTGSKPSRVQVESPHNWFRRSLRRVTT